ncbi:MAG: aldo/keto reductase [Candidatus Hodarchaeota archaeon]
MEYRKHHDLEISEVGVGCYALSGVYGAVDIPGFQRMLQCAYRMGVNFFDTAEGYGNAEKILGDSIKPFREEVYIATKVGIREGFTPNLSKTYIHEACARSLEQLSTDYIDLYQVHFNDPRTPVAETIEALEDLIAEEKIRHYGIGHLPGIRVKEYCEQGSPFSILMELSAVARKSRDELLPFCHTYDVAGIGFSATGRGILTGKYESDTQFEPGDLRKLDPLFQRARFESALRIKDYFIHLAQEYGTTPVQLAIAWVLAQPKIICALTGSSKINHLEENLGGSGLHLKRSDLKRLEQLFVREEKDLAEREREIIHSILIDPLPPDPEQAFTDLVYVLETSHDLGLLTEDIARSILVKLWPLKKELSRSSQPELEAIQKQLKALLE